LRVLKGLFVTLRSCINNPAGLSMFFQLIINLLYLLLI
jgi:hypothetical protein